MYRKIDGQQILLGKLRDQIAAEGTQSGWARRAGVSRQIVCDVLRGHRPIGDEIAAALGYRRIVLFERLPEPQPLPELTSPMVDGPSVTDLLIQELLDRPEYEVL